MQLFIQFNLISTICAIISVCITTYQIVIEKLDLPLFNIIVYKITIFQIFWNLINLFYILNIHNIQAFNIHRFKYIYYIKCM